MAILRQFSPFGEDTIAHINLPRRYTYYALEFLETVKQDSKKTMAEFLAVCPKRLCISTVGTRTDLFARDPKKVISINTSTR